MYDENKLRFDFFMSQIKHLADVKETEKTKISIVYHEEKKISCILRICKKRDLTPVCEALVAVQNANTMSVYDFVYYNGDTYILEENIDGQTVADLMDQEGCFSEKKTAAIIIDVCKGLENLHSMQPPMVHNDINPTNIKIRPDGTVKLFDFDISRLYKKGQSQNTVLFGTEEFAAPEHYGYGQSEPRTDIYCLGVTMHKMLTGKVLSSEHKSTYTGKLKKIINKCLAIDPNNRYSSVVALRKDLEKFLAKKGHGLFVLISVILVGVLFWGVIFGVPKTNHPDSEPGATTITEPTKTNVPDANTTENQTDISGIDETENSEKSETVDTTEPVLNNTRETAYAIIFDENQTGICNANTANWYKFMTGNANTICRVGISTTETYSNMLFPILNVAIYDSVGIKIQEFDLWADDEYDSCDLYLEANTQYFIKITLGGRFDTSDYTLSVSEIPCDAGIDKDSAAELALGVRYTAALNSALSDWFVFNVPENGKYTVTVHNIDVGCTINFSAAKGNASLCSGWAKNEDSGVRTFNAEAGDSVYLEIESNGSEANGTYIIEIDIE